MSTSDSDYSIDWLASDEDDSDSDTDSDSAERLSPRDAEETHVAPSSTSSSSSVSCSHCGAVQRRRRRRSSDSRDEGPDSRADTLSPVQGFTSVGAELRSNRKRLHSDGEGEDGLCEKPEADTENELFLHKCLELQGYIPPLSSILQALISGRYSDRLGSFQENVAIDRIQRILGVLQNPHLGGRFLNILLKIEVMLLSWFPHIRPSVSQTDDSSAAKKLKPHSSASPPPLPPPSSSSDVESSLAASPSSTRLKWLHTSPICSLKTPESLLARRPASPLSPPPAHCRQEMTQDNAISSTSDLHSAPPRHLLPAAAAPRISRGPLPFKISSPCLERLLQAKESIIAPRTDEDEGWTL